jgi:hypothetical protein
MEVGITIDLVHKLIYVLRKTIIRKKIIVALAHSGAAWIRRLHQEIDGTNSG